MAISGKRRWGGCGGWRHARLENNQRRGEEETPNRPRVGRALLGLLRLLQLWLAQLGRLRDRGSLLRKLLLGMRMRMGRMRDRIWASVSILMLALLLCKRSGPVGSPGLDERAGHKGRRIRVGKIRVASTTTKDMKMAGTHVSLSRSGPPCWEESLADS